MRTIEVPAKPLLDLLENVETVDGEQVMQGTCVSDENNVAVSINVRKTGEDVEFWISESSGGDVETAIEGKGRISNEILTLADEDVQAHYEQFTEVLSVYRNEIARAVNVSPDKNT